MKPEPLSQAFASHIRGLRGFTFQKAMEPYQHLGATLTDAMFQAGVNYNNAVVPRINKIKSYASAATISGLLALFSRLKPEQFFNWKGYKPANFLKMVYFLARLGIETEEDLRAWLQKPGSTAKLLDQPGIGQKTADYLKILVGLQSVAVDRHILTMLEQAGIHTSDYKEAKAIVVGAAGILGVSPQVLDHSIWLYLSGGN